MSLARDIFKSQTHRFHIVETKTVELKTLELKKV